MKKYPSPLFATSVALLLGGCFVGAGPSSVDWTAGTWTEGEFAAGSQDDECGIVAVLSGLDSPLQYKLGPKSNDGEDTGSPSDFDTGDEGLSDDQIASIQNNLWEGCTEPGSWGGAGFGCDGFPLHELHKAKWKSTLKDSFCPEATEMTLKYGSTEGLVINKNEIFLVHDIRLECGSDEGLSCSSRYVSRMHSSSGN